MDKALTKEKALSVAKAIVSGKIRNQRHILDRFCWENHDETAVRAISAQLNLLMDKTETVSDISTLRGLEGEASEFSF